MNIAVKTPVENVSELPLAELNPAHTKRFQNDTIWPVFERLRREDPVHFTPDSEFGPYWSVTKWEDIMAVDTNHEVFSSAEGIGLAELEVMEQQEKAMAAMGQPPRSRNGAGFISMDEPEHAVHRKAVSPTVAPHNLAQMAPVVRERAGLILDSLPIGQEFDWVDLVSKELTAMTLATLFDFPFEQRRMLTHWSDMMTNAPGHGPVKSWEHKLTEVNACFAAFRELWNARVNAEPTFDLISMLAHGEATRDMDVHEFNGNIGLLIIGGNDTTRNTISGSVYALNKNPDQYDKLRADPSLIPNMVSETIRYQTPLSYMRRRAKEDFELQGQRIKAGDKVAMWFISGNRDDTIFEDPNRFWIERPNARRHMSFGFGIHRCMGNRAAELQLQILWEEILKRFPKIEVVGEPERNMSNFILGYTRLPVRIPA